MLLADDLGFLCNNSFPSALRFAGLALCMLTAEFVAFSSAYDVSKLSGTSIIENDGQGGSAWPITHSIHKLIVL